MQRVMSQDFDANSDQVRPSPSSGNYAPPPHLTPAVLAKLSADYTRLEEQKMGAEHLARKTGGLPKASRQILFDYIRHGEYVLQYRMKRRGEKAKGKAGRRGEQALDPRAIESIQREARKQYIANVILIVNSFFEYGFLNKKQESNAGSSYIPEALIAVIGGKNSAALAQNQRALGEGHLAAAGGGQAESGSGNPEVTSGNQYLEKIHHYWDYLSR